MSTIFSKRDISDSLKAEAIKLGLCDQWQAEWGNPTKDDLCEKFIRGLDFCIEHDFPNLRLMKRHFDGVMQNHGIFVDEREICLCNQGTVVANGRTTGQAFYDEFSVGQVYVRHQSAIRIVARGNAVVNVRCYDTPKVEVVCKDSARVTVIRHDQGLLSATGNVKVINRNHKN